MRIVWWLTWRELVNRKAACLLGIGMVAAAVALCAATELVLRAREAAIATEIDQIGPGAHLVPAGMTAEALARFELGDAFWNFEAVAALQRQVAPHVRRVERRLVAKVPGEHASVPVIGIETDRVVSPFGELHRLAGARVALGSELSRRLGLHMGDTVSLAGQAFQVAAVLPTTTGTDDLAVFMALEELQHRLGLPDVVNELRLFLVAERLPAALVSHLEFGTPAASVLQVDRGEVAESELHQSLKRDRRVLYTIVAIVVALCMALWSFLNSAERRLELATAIAVGGTTSTVLRILIARAAAIGLVGAVLGYGLGVVTALFQQFEVARLVIGFWKLPVVLIGGTTLLSIGGALPAAIMTAKADHVALLQE